LGHLEVVRLLVKNGADMQAKEKVSAVCCMLYAVPAVQCSYAPVLCAPMHMCTYAHMNLYVGVRWW
jgi:hypothetical protein